MLLGNANEESPFYIAFKLFSLYNSDIDIAGCYDDKGVSSLLYLSLVGLKAASYLFEV